MQEPDLCLQGQGALTCPGSVLEVCSAAPTPRMAVSLSPTRGTRGLGPCVRSVRSTVPQCAQAACRHVEKRQGTNGLWVVPFDDPGEGVVESSRVRPRSPEQFRQFRREFERCAAVSGLLRRRHVPGHGDPYRHVEHGDARVTEIRRRGARRIHPLRRFVDPVGPLVFGDFLHVGVEHGGDHSFCVVNGVKFAAYRLDRAGDMPQHPHVGPEPALRIGAPQVAGPCTALDLSVDVVPALESEGLPQRRPSRTRGHAAVRSHEHQRVIG